MARKHEPVDMSTEAIKRRIEEMRGLCDLMSYLGELRPAVEAAEKARKH